MLSGNLLNDLAALKGVRLLLVFKGPNGLAPSYITVKQSARSLRSASMEYLEVMATNTKSYGDRAFAVSGPRL